MKNRTKRTQTPPVKPAGRKAITQRGKWKAVFLGVLAETGNVSAARKAANVAKETLWAHKAKDKAFAQAWAEALDEAVDVLKAEAWRRAKDGVDVPITHEGEQCFVAIQESTGLVVPREKAYAGEPVMVGNKMITRWTLRPGFKEVPFVKKQYSDALLMMLLKTGRPSEFGDKLQHALPVDAAEGQIVLVHTAPPDDQ